MSSERKERTSSFSVERMPTERAFCLNSFSSSENHTEASGAVMFKPADFFSPSLSFRDSRIRSMILSLLKFTFVMVANMARIVNRPSSLISAFPFARFTQTANPLSVNRSRS